MITCCVSSRPTSVPKFYWDQLTEVEHAEFFALRDKFSKQQGNSITKERHQSSFQSEIATIQMFVQKCPERIEARSIVAGIAFQSSYICVNTMQLKELIGRCKSSINCAFQQMGYNSTKNNVHKYILQILPSLSNSPNNLRQWTLRFKEGEDPVAEKVKPVVQPQIPNLSMFRPLPKPLPVPNLSLGYSENCAHVVIYDPLPIPSLQNFHESNELFSPSFEDPMSIYPGFDDLIDLFEPVKNNKADKNQHISQEDEWPSFDDSVNESSVELGHW